MLPPIFNVLIGSPAVTAIVGVGTNARIYGAGRVPPDTTKPYIVWQIISANPDNNLSDTPEQDDQRVQVDIYAKDQVQSRLLATAARNAIEAVMHIVYGPWDQYEADTALYRWSFDVSWLLDR